MTDQKSVKKASLSRRKRASPGPQVGAGPGVSAGRTRSKAPSQPEVGPEANIDSDQDSSGERGDPKDLDFEETLRSPRKSKRRSSSTVMGPKPKKQDVERSERSSRSSKYQAEKKRLWRMRQPYLKCPDCDYSTKDKETYGSHIAKHNPSVERFLCEDCAKTFRNKRSFRCHLRTHGSPEQLHQCSHCDFRTPSKINWVQHLAVKHKVDADGNPLTAAYACTECSYTCMAEYQLKAHFNRKHQPDKAHKCAQCPYSSHIRFEVEKHMKIKHLNIRNYVCDRCGKTSQTKSGLERHKQTHTPGLKPYKCTVCDAAYADNRKLKSHLTRHENNEKPFRCPLCTHRCHRRDNLQMHLKRIHKTTFACLTTELTAAADRTSSVPESAVVEPSCSSSQQSTADSRVVDTGGEPRLQQEVSAYSDTSDSGHCKTTSEFIKYDVEREEIDYRKSWKFKNRKRGHPMELDKCGEQEGKKRAGKQKGARKRKGKPMKISKAKKNRKVLDAEAKSATNEPTSVVIKDEVGSEDDTCTTVQTVILGTSRQTRKKPRKNYSDDQVVYSDCETDKAGEPVGIDGQNWDDESPHIENGKDVSAVSGKTTLQNTKAVRSGPKRLKKEKVEPAASRFSCDLCSKSFKNKESFRRHVRRHEDPDALLGCPHCEFKTLQKSTWVQHLAVIHKEDPHGNQLSDDMKCNMCNFSCVTKYQLKAHVVRKHGDKPFKCNECSYRSSSKSDIEKHIGIRHRKERLNLCHICGFCSQTKGGYNRHVRSHEKIKPFYCTICAKRYADSPKLKSHLLRHVSDEKRFVCQYCGHSCRRLDNLQMHLKRIHKTTTTSENARTYYQESQDAGDKSASVPSTSIPPVQVQLVVDNEQSLSGPCQVYAECVIQDSLAMTLALNHAAEM